MFRGTQVSLNRTVAIKMLSSHLADGDAQARFQREALTLAQLAHPNIVSIYDVEEHQGNHFIIMEFVDGGCLADTCGNGQRLDPARCVEVMAPVVSALGAAHERGIIHRDLKPDNILFTDSGRPKLTDFGIAHMAGSHSKTRTGVMLGTPYYMSPEQARGLKVQPQSDLYAVGVVMYEALCGAVPLTAEDPVSLALKHVQEEPISLDQRVEGVPAALVDVVHRALAKDPADRFSSAGAMQEAMEVAVGVSATSWSPRTTGSRDALASLEAVGSRAVEKIGKGAEQVLAGAGELVSGRSDGLRENLAKAGSRGSSVVSRTTGWLRQPALAGLPMAFWAGAVLLATAAGVATVPGLVGGEGPGPGSQGNSTVEPESGSAVGRSGAPGGGGGGQGADLSLFRSGGTTRRLTPDQADALRRGARGDNPREQDADPTPPPVTPPEEKQRVTPIAPVDTEAERRAWEATASRELRAVVARQAEALAVEDRTLFLRDVHRSRRSEAGRIYDAATGEWRDHEAAISNVRIEFEGREKARVTYDARLTRTHRDTGQTQESRYTERWELVQEGGRWWLQKWS